MKFFLVTILSALVLGCSTNPQSPNSSKHVKNGEVVTKRSDGTIRTIVTYQDGIKHGTSYLYYPDGINVQLEIPYVAGARHGTSRKYYNSGNLYAETNYESDEIHGMRKTWYRNGNLKAEVNYYRGFPALGTKEYFISGKPKKSPALVYQIDGNYLIVKTTRPCKYTALYIGKLINDRYLNEEADLELIPQNAEEFLIDLRVYTPSYLALQDIICSCKTSQGNPLILKKRVRL